MADLIEHVMINKLGDDLDDAITTVGGDTSGVSHIMQYPSIIREQLSAQGITNIDKFLLEGDSCIIKADENGYDEYNTDYAQGTKTGLNPNTLYIRICTAVKNIEPVYIDLTPVTQLIGEGGESGNIDIDEIINNVINSIQMQNNYVSNQKFDTLESNVTNLETTVNGFETDITNLETNVTNLETNVTNLETTVNGFETDITTLESNVTNLETAVNELLDPKENGGLGEEETDSFFE